MYRDLPQRKQQDVWRVLSITRLPHAFWDKNCGLVKWPSWAVAGQHTWPRFLLICLVKDVEVTLNNISPQDTSETPQAGKVFPNSAVHVFHQRFKPKSTASLMSSAPRFTLNLSTFSALIKAVLEHFLLDWNRRFNGWRRGQTKVKPTASPWWLKTLPSESYEYLTALNSFVKSWPL